MSKQTEIIERLRRLSKAKPAPKPDADTPSSDWVDELASSAEPDTPEAQCDTGYRWEDEDEESDSEIPDATHRAADDDDLIPLDGGVDDDDEAEEDGDIPVLVGAGCDDALAGVEALHYGTDDPVTPDLDADELADKVANLVIRKLAAALSKSCRGQLYES